MENDPPESPQKSKLYRVLTNRGEGDGEQARQMAMARGALETMEQDWRETAYGVFQAAREATAAQNVRDMLVTRATIADRMRNLDYAHGQYLSRYIDFLMDFPGSEP